MGRERWGAVRWSIWLGCSIVCIFFWAGLGLDGMRWVGEFWRGVGCVVPGTDVFVCDYGAGVILV
jgi:hypothetical protein